MVRACLPPLTQLEADVLGGWGDPDAEGPLDELPVVAADGLAALGA